MKIILSLLLLSTSLFAKTVEVNIQAMKFKPNVLVIKKGDTITWKNLDVMMHTVTSGAANKDSGVLFDSGLLKRNETFSYTFNTKGTFKYYCKPHPILMTGQVEVK